jgi:hypothetical protein
MTHKLCVWLSFFGAVGYFITSIANFDASILGLELIHDYHVCVDVIISPPYHSLICFFLSFFLSFFLNFFITALISLIYAIASQLVNEVTTLKEVTQFGAVSIDVEFNFYLESFMPYKTNQLNLQTVLLIITCM